MITNAKKVLAGITAVAALSLGGSAIAGADGGSAESENDAAAQAAACNAVGIDPNGNVQYDDETGKCTLDSGGNEEE